MLTERGNDMLKDKAGRKVLRLLATILALLGLLAVTNPSEGRHRQAIRRHAEMEAPYVFSENALARGRYQYENYLFFSRTRLYEEVGTWGFLGIVITTERLRPMLIELRKGR
jgi:hypothetical protein